MVKTNLTKLRQMAEKTFPTMEVSPPCGSGYINGVISIENPILESPSVDIALDDMTGSKSNAPSFAVGVIEFQFDESGKTIRINVNGVTFLRIKELDYGNTGQPNSFKHCAPATN